VTIGVYTFEIHLPTARSLKDKRQVVRRLKDRLRAHHNLAVAELEEHADLWQRSGLAVVSVASRREPLERLFASVLREAESEVPGSIIETGADFIESSDGGATGWEGHWS
jgi:uncharacterized protein YlxP (DUF503 family)